MGELYNPYPKLPKNIRQIGERDQIVKLYVEDYVNTYLKRLYPVGGQDLRVGLLLGNVEEYDGIPYIFLDGALEMDGVTQNGEKVEFYEGAWKKAYQDIEQMFPKRTVQGWFLCGAPGSQLSPLNYWKQHGQYFSGDHKLMYLNSGLENEEAVYVASDDGFYKLRGHNIYYERNQMMQDYMILRREARRVDVDVDNTVIHNFRQKMESRKAEAAAEKNIVGILGTLCSVLAITVLAGSVTMFNNYHKMKEMEHVIASAFPAGTSTWQDYSIDDEEPEVIIQSGSGTEQVSGTGKIIPETMSEEAGKTESQIQSEAASTGETEPAAAEPAAVETQPETQIPTLGEAEDQAAAVGESIAKQSIYEVAEGETLYGICLKKYHDLNMLDEICELNGLDDQNKITTGQKLIMP